MVNQLLNENGIMSKQQRWRLHELTGEDTRLWNMSAKEAEAVIQEWEKKGDNGNNLYRWREIHPEWTKFLKTPMTFADVRLFFGDQRQGKSITAVASVVDDYYRFLNYIMLPSGERIKANALDRTGKLELKEKGIRYNHLRHVRVFNENETDSKIIYLPNDVMVLSPVKVFANFHLKGIKYVLANLDKLIGFINTPLMTNGWVVLDESILTDKKETSTLVGKFMDWFGAQQGKRHLRMVIASQYPNMIQSRFHLFATTRVQCSYNPDTAMVGLEVNSNSPVMESTDYYSKIYRRFFFTDEIIDVPQYKIDRVMTQMMG